MVSACGSGRYVSPSGSSASGLPRSGRDTVSGNWYPLSEGSFVHDVAQYPPAYWLVQASHVSLGGESWEAIGWTVVAAWTAVLGGLALAAYRRDTERV